MSALVICARCGTECAPTGQRRCDCEPPSELARTVLAATRLAGPGADARVLARRLRQVAADRAEARRRAS